MILYRATVDFSNIILKLLIKVVIWFNVIDINFILISTKLNATLILKTNKMHQCISQSIQLLFKLKLLSYFKNYHIQIITKFFSFNKIILCKFAWQHFVYKCLFFCFSFRNNKSIGLFSGNWFWFRLYFSKIDPFLKPFLYPKSFFKKNTITFNYFSI